MMSSQAQQASSLPAIVQGSDVPQQPPVTQSQQQFSAAPQNIPRPPPPETMSDRWSLPPGWRLVHSPRDGRVYYWEEATGRTSWTHPMAPGVTVLPKPSSGGIAGGFFGSLRPNRGIPPPPVDNLDRRSTLLDTPANATRRPDSHQCCAIASMLCCLPIGVCALYHSFNVDRHWKQGRYGDAMNSSKQAYNYAWFGCVLGGIIAIIWWARRDGWEMPNWDFDFGDR
mmetsp:Transcript_24495/g.41636  ORF Transcript_24495/g.41636 Transcript_24495/m.41636 type:complete len:226 (-) Transcript_24495:84-761(-)